MFVSLVFWLAFANDAAPEMPAWESARVWPDRDPTASPAIAERFAPLDPGLGVHSGLHRLDLDGCWRQHAALSGDLSTWFCAEVKVDKRGQASAKVTTLSDPRPGLSTCIETMVSHWEGKKGAPVKGTMCRSVHTNLSDEARAVWKENPWGEVGTPGARRAAGEAPPLEVGRPKVDQARIVSVLDGGAASADASLASHPIALRDRAATTARRWVTDHAGVVAQCFADHGVWRVPERAAGTLGSEALPVLIFNVDVTVGEAGPVRVRGGRTEPATHASVAACAAAAMDPDLPESMGDLVLAVPVVIGP